jgi:two-component sensor histidine kinase
MTLSATAAEFSERLGAILERISNARSRDGALLVAAQAARDLAGADGVYIAARNNEPMLVARADDESVRTCTANSSLPQPLRSDVESFRMVVTDGGSDLWVELTTASRLTFTDVITVPLGAATEFSALSFFWRSGSVQIADGLPSLQAIAWATGIALAARRADEIVRGQRSQIADLQRRARNILAIVRSIVRRSGETAQSQEDFTSHLEGRVSALARIQGALLTFGHAGPELEDLIRSEMTANAVREAQFEISGPSIRLTAQAAQSLALAIHELTTNALKFGALAVSTGHIDVSWTFDTTASVPRLRLAWTESGVPNVPKSSRRGFGHELIERVLPYELDATTAIAFAPEGVRCTIDVPLTGRTRNTEQPRGQEFFHDNE